MESWEFALDRFHSFCVPGVSGGVAPVGVEEGDGGGGGVEGDEGGSQGPSQAPGQKAPPWYHLQTSISLQWGNLGKAWGAGSMMQS